MQVRAVTVWVCALVPMGALVLCPSCASSGDELQGPESRQSPGTGASAGSSGTAGTDAATGGNAITIVVPSPDADLGQSVVITPADAVIDVTIVDGVVTSIGAGDSGSASVTFKATYGNEPVTPRWSIDRGELGTFDTATATFTASGLHAGTAKISASVGSNSGETTVSVRIHSTQNGKPPQGGSDGGTGYGGIGGVGGEGLGAPVDGDTKSKLLAATTTKPSSNDFGWLYPEDKTVWPRGILAPLLQWETLHSLGAVYIHLQEKNFEFRGFYSGADLMHQPIDPSAWDLALGANGGEYLHAEITALDNSGKVYGPIPEDWLVASGRLRGTVYYGSYSTSLGTGSGTTANVLAIPAGATDPVLAIPSLAGKCVTCHTVSQDGSTLFAQIGVEPVADGWSYWDGASYDLRSQTLIQTYTANDASGTVHTLASSDGSYNARKFNASGVWHDGTFALHGASDNWGFPGGGSSPNGTGGIAQTALVYRRDNGNVLPVTGLAGIDVVATPSFSPDGKKVAFNYWTGTAPPGGANGGSIDIMDFTCNGPEPDAGSDAGGARDAAAHDGPAPAGAPPSCTNMVFSNLSRIYQTPDIKALDGWTSGGYLGWPAWLPDSSGIVFHAKISSGQYASHLLTWRGSQADLWFVTVPTDPTEPPCAVRMGNLNGDTHYNYEPTVNPIASGGYYWTVFTSRRKYGNIADGDPYDQGDGNHPIRKKLWVAALDQRPTPGQDPSHPAFYLPGQELNAGNSRGLWVVEPCRDNGQSCQTGDECCGGFCRPPTGGGAGLVCGGTASGCANEFEKCSTSSDCCGYLPDGEGFVCTNGRCAQPPAIPPPR